MLGEYLKQEPSSRFYALPNHTLCCSSGLDREPYKNTSVFFAFSSPCDKL